MPSTSTASPPADPFLPPAGGPQHGRAARFGTPPPGRRDNGYAGRQESGLSALLALASPGTLSRAGPVSPLPTRSRPAASPPGQRLRRPAGPGRRILRAAGAVTLIILATGLAIGVHTQRLPGGRSTLAAGWPGLRFLIYAAWLLPLAELAMLAAGQLHYRFRFLAAPPGTFRHLVIQVTTTGAEQHRVNEVIAQIRGYRLRMSHQIWVVTEPGRGDRYPLADRVLTVPAGFTARSERKARALEYSRQARAGLGLDRADIKILFNDDDVAPTRGYIERAFAADYDVCEGITAPRAQYAARPFGHFLASHADDMRTHSCLVYCSVFQGLLGRPLHVHGEGLTVTGEAERVVSWDWPAFASEDLVFGQRAARAGLRWGWFHEYVELTSPWTLRDFITQRRRWVWGDIHAITHRDVLPPAAALVVAVKYLIGLLALVLSVAGLYLKLTGRLPRSSAAYDVAKLALLSWLALFFSCGWIGAGSRVEARNDDSRLLHAVAAVVMVPVSSLLALAGTFLPLIMGNPGTFEVIRKTRGPR
jgi:hypothetical protein